MAPPRHFLWINESRWAAAWEGDEMSILMIHVLPRAYTTRKSIITLAETAECGFHPRSPPNLLPQPRLLHPLHIDVHRLLKHNIPYRFPFNLPILAPIALPTYAFQQHAGRLIIRILRDEPTGKGLFEDALAQSFGTLEVGFDCCF